MTLTVRPAVKTARQSIALTPLDMLFPFPYYSNCLYVYRSPAKRSVINASVLKESLSKALVHFYPMAGRYRLIGNGTAMEIDCNDAGVLYIEAQTNSDLGDFTPSSEMSLLISTIDNTQDISSYPLFAVQVTYFNCSGVSIGISGEHHCMDGSSVFHFMCSWSEIARGLDISVLPFLDRSLIRPRDHPRPKFDHPEFLPHYQPATYISQTNSQQFKVSVFKLFKIQLDKMKAKVGAYNTFKVVAGHIWNCVCKARGIGRDVETVLIMPVNARFNRWKPELPHNFFGSAISLALVAARAGDLESYAAAKIYKTLVQIDNECFRSAVDRLGLNPHPPIISDVDPNFFINSWAKLRLTNINFGWGQPVYLGPADFDCESAYIIPHDHDGSISVVIALRPQHMEMFHNLLYASECDKRETNFFLAKL